MCTYAQLYQTLCNPMDCSLPGTSIHGIFPARIPEWIAIFSSKGSSQLRDWTCISCIHTHTQSVIKETKLSQCCNSHYHLQNENDSWCKGNNDQSQLPKVHQENPVKTESSERFCPRCMCMCSVHTTESMVISLWPHGLQTARLLCPWNLLGKNTEAGCRFLLQAIFPTQGPNPSLPCLLRW